MAWWSLQVGQSLKGRSTPQKDVARVTVRARARFQGDRM